MVKRLFGYRPKSASGAGNVPQTGSGYEQLQGSVLDTGSEVCS